MIAGQKWFDNEKLWLVFLVVLAATIRIFFLLKCENMPGDATGNVSGALLILENPRLALNFNGNTSMLYRYALASFMSVWRDPVLAPRFFSTLFGIFLVVPYYGTTKILFDRTIAFFSSLVLVFYPLHVIQSGVTTSDAAYYFFLFGSFYYFFNYKNSQKRFLILLLSALSFNIASLLRFESWIFIPVFFLLLGPRGWKKAFLFLVFSMVFPCVWLFLNQAFHHELLYSVNAAGRQAHAQILSGMFAYDPRPWSWLAILWASSGPSLVIGGLSGIAWAFLARQKRQLALFFLVLLLAFTVNVLAARMWGDSRYSIMLGLLLIPYAWFFIERVLVFLRIRRTLCFVLCLVFPAVGFMQTTKSLISEMFCITPSEIVSIAAWLKNNVHADETLVIEADPFDVFPTNILVRSGISPKRCEVTYAPLYVKNDFQNKAKAEQYFLTKRPQYLVLNSEGSLCKTLVFYLDRKKQQVGDISFEAMYEQDLGGYGKYIIYKIAYPKPLGE